MAKLLILTQVKRSITDSGVVQMMHFYNQSTGLDESYNLGTPGTPK